MPLLISASSWTQPGSQSDTSSYLYANFFHPIFTVSLKTTAYRVHRSDNISMTQLFQFCKPCIQTIDLWQPSHDALYHRQRWLWQAFWPHRAKAHFPEPGCGVSRWVTTDGSFMWPSGWATAARQLPLSALLVCLAAHRRQQLVLANLPICKSVCYNWSQYDVTFRQLLFLLGLLCIAVHYASPTLLPLRSIPSTPPLYFALLSTLSCT